MKKNHIILSFVFMTFSFISFSQDWNGNASTNYINRLGKVTIGGDVSSAKFNIVGTQYISHFYHGANENIYLRPGKDLGTIFMDIGSVTIGGDYTGSKFTVQGTQHNSHFYHGTNENLYLRPGKDLGAVFMDVGSVTVGGNYTAAKFTVQGTQLNSHFYHGADENTYIRPGKSSGMVLFDVGNVGIGTADPKNKLSVNGTVWAKEVKVSLIDAADWVFEDDYELRSLEEVEAFVKINKHLPDVPSADEFREYDLNLAEMDNTLLQKIEELTLYLIEQDKRLNKALAKIEQLEKKVNK